MLATLPTPAAPLCLASFEELIGPWIDPRAAETFARADELLALERRTIRPRTSRPGLFSPTRLYVFDAPEVERIKIGVSVSPLARHVELEDGRTFSLIALGDIGASRAHEAALHRALSRHRFPLPDGPGRTEFFVRSAQPVWAVAVSLRAAWEAA
jgi:hypothetical protein